MDNYSAQLIRKNTLEIERLRYNNSVLKAALNNSERKIKELQNVIEILWGRILNTENEVRTQTLMRLEHDLHKISRGTSGRKETWDSETARKENGEGKDTGKTGA